MTKEKETLEEHEKHCSMCQAVNEQRKEALSTAEKNFERNESLVKRQLIKHNGKLVKQISGLKAEIDDIITKADGFKKDDWAEFGDIILERLKKVTNP